MTQTKNYVILGARRKGAAAAYDMALWGNAYKIILADLDLKQLKRDHL